MQVLDLFQLAGIEETAEGIGHFECPKGRQAGTEILDDHPRHLEAAGQRRDRRWQVQAQFAGRERRLVLFQIAERSDLGQQQRSPPGLFRQGGRKGAGGAPVRQQDHGVGQGLGRMIPQPVEHPGCEILEERPSRLDRIPARPGRLEGVEPGDHRAPTARRAASRCMRREVFIPLRPVGPRPRRAPGDRRHASSHRRGRSRTGGPQRRTCATSR